MFRLLTRYAVIFFCMMWAISAAQHQKYALVIGVKEYKHVAPLQNSLNDAMDMASTLRKKGFHVIDVYDPPTKRVMQDKIREYFQMIRERKEAAGLVFYSGHGMQVDGINYLIPADANPLEKFDLDDQCVNMNYIMDALQNAGNGLNIIIMDACRNNPFRSFTRSGERGLSIVDSPKGSYIVYATKPGAVASDGVGRNGLFTSKLLQYINTEGLNLEQVFKQVARDVSNDSGDQQRPWISSDYTGEFYFSPPASTPQNTAPVSVTAPVSAPINAVVTNTQTVASRSPKKPLIIKADDKVKPFGADNPALTVSLAGIADGEVLDRAPLVTTTASKTSLPGTYPIIVAGGSDLDYDFYYEPGTLTITKATQKISLNLPSGMKEGQTPYVLRAIATSGEPVDLSLVSGNATLNGNVLTVLGPGIVTIKASQKGNAIYEPAEVISSGAVATRLNLIARAEDKIRPYGKDNPPLTVSYFGLLEGETLERAPLVTTTATKTSLPGNYPITASGGVDADYNFSYEAGTMTITKLTQKINLVLPAMKEGQPPIPLRGTATSGEPVEYSLLSGNAKIADNVLTIQGPGPISIQAIQKGSAIYEPTEVIVSGEVMARINLVAKADDKIRPYGTENPVFTVSYTGLVSGGVLKSAPIAKTTATSASLPGTYPITVTGGYDDDYNISYQEGTLTISKLFQAVSFFLPEQMVEGDFFTLSAMATTGEPVTYEVVSGNAKIENGQLHILGAGKVTVKAIQKGTALYGASEATASTEVAGKMFVIARADDKTRPYGMENPPMTVSFSGMMSGHSGDHIDEFPVATTSATKNSLPGNYEITVSGGADDEYKFNYKTGTLIITKLFQAVSLSLPKEIKYGPTPYTLTASSSSGAPISYSLIAGNATLINDQLTVLGPGPITIKASQMGTSIYEPAEAEATTLAVAPIVAATSGRGKGSATRVNLIVKAEDKTRPYGAKNPEFTIKFFGLKSGEVAIDELPSLSTTANKNSPPGNYPIVAEGGSDDDYNFSYQPGTLTITKLSQTIKFTLPEGLKQGASYTLSAVTDSGEPVAFSLISGNAKIEGNKLTINGAGQITVKASQSGTNIYEPAELVVSSDLAAPVSPVRTEAPAKKVEAKPLEVKEGEEVYTVVDENASPIGGMAAFYKHVASELNYPAHAVRMGVEGKVYVEFIINKDGSISDANVVRGIGGGCDEEAVRVVNNSPDWTPAKQNGKIVRQKYTIPITFKL